MFCELDRSEAKRRRSDGDEARGPGEERSLAKLGDKTVMRSAPGVFVEQVMKMRRNDKEAQAEP